MDWKPIDQAPDDFDRPGDRRYWNLRDRDGHEAIGKRTLWNNSGWTEHMTNRELRPVEFAPIED